MAVKHQFTGVLASHQYNFGNGLEDRCRKQAEPGSSGNLVAKVGDRSPRFYLVSTPDAGARHERFYNLRRKLEALNLERISGLIINAKNRTPRTPSLTCGYLLSRASSPFSATVFQTVTEVA